MEILMCQFWKKNRLFFFKNNQSRFRFVQCVKITKKKRQSELSVTETEPKFFFFQTIQMSFSLEIFFEKQKNV